ncbi:hypothetical protein GOP47_0023317 [Adiantum capillus-veneris]|uniref:Uncharacterized protein n=1 Tax=Adiantum capillus-veneris TaxID=13818 RepID=A0A9D4U860_ADICA|nr:hypothetical protein GOP47_0023317 [Adiantum capillus-veneris]
MELLDVRSLFGSVWDSGSGIFLCWGLGSGPSSNGRERACPVVIGLLMGVSRLADYGILVVPLVMYFVGSHVFCWYGLASGSVLKTLFIMLVILVLSLHFGDGGPLGVVVGGCRAPPISGSMSMLLPRWQVSVAAQLVGFRFPFFDGISSL